MINLVEVNASRSRALLPGPETPDVSQLLTHQMMETLSTLQARLTASKRLLFALFECPEFDADELHELGSTALMAERLVDDLSRSIDIRAERTDVMRLDPHELQVLKTALLVDDTIDFAIGRMATPASGATALH